MSRSRTWCFTLNNPLTNLLPIHGEERYVIWQREVGASGTIHLQGYIETKKPMRLANMVLWLPGAHFEQRRGSRDQARDYCKKADSRQEGPWERGSWDEGGSGARNDLLEIKRKVDENVPEATIAEEHFETWLRHYRGLREYKKIKTAHREWKTQVEVYWGKSGTGKSRRAMDENPGAYWKTRDEWWDAYDGHATIVIDDFYGWLPYDFLLRLMDRYPLDLPSKGGFRRLAATKLVITSNKPPEEWYPSIVDKTPLLRRIDSIKEY